VSITSPDWPLPQFEFKKRFKAQPAFGRLIIT
jgi:hypothetical protein